MNALSKYSASLLLQSLAFLLYWHFIIKTKAFRSWRTHLIQYPEDDVHLPSKSTEKINNSAQLKATQIETAYQIQEHISAIVRNSPIKFNCMRRCLTLKHILNKQSIYPKFHIGVKLDADKTLSAHSWLSLHGKIINDSEDNLKNYTELTVNEKWAQYISVM